MLNNFRLGNLVIQNMDNTQLDGTNAFVDEFILLAKYHAEGVKNRVGHGTFQEESVAMVRLDYEHSLLIHVDPELKNNPHFFDYNNLTGRVSESMDYAHFKEMNNCGRLAYFESRMDSAHMLDMSSMLRPGTMEQVHSFVDEIDVENEMYEIGY